MRHKCEVEINISEVDTSDYTCPKYSSGELYVTCTVSLYVEPQACEHKINIDSYTMFFVDQDGGAIGDCDDYPLNDALIEEIRIKALKAAWDEYNG